MDKTAPQGRRFFDEAAAEMQFLVKKRKHFDTFGC
jgi:hypothetical protein